MKRWAVYLLPLMWISAVLIAAAQQPTKTIWDGAYSADEAMRGEQAYQQNCSKCHRPDLTGGGQPGAPALAGPAFFDRWHELSVFDLFFAAQGKMDEDANPVVFDLVYISPEEFRDIVAYILKQNGAPAGAPLPADFDALRQIQIVGKPQK